jgi:GNAT superfamily N-acetyltransferase
LSAPKVRPASVADAALIHRFILELAEYERLAHEVVSTPEDVERALEGGKVFAELVEIGGEPVGFSLSFYTFSTFVGRHGVYLEDLYVRPAARGAGAGKALLVSLAQRCVAEQLGRLEWAVLDWNAPAIGFYERLGSEPMDEWTVRRLTGDALEALAAES